MRARLYLCAHVYTRTLLPLRLDLSFIHFAVRGAARRREMGRIDSSYNVSKQKHFLRASKNVNVATCVRSEWKNIVERSKPSHILRIRHSR